MYSKPEWSRFQFLLRFSLLLLTVTACVAPAHSQSHSWPSPLDRLKRSHVEQLPLASRIPELVAVAGDDQGRHAGPVKCVAVSPNDRLIATGSRDQTVQIRNALTLRTTRTFPHPDDVDSVMFSANGKTVLSSCWDGMLRAWSVVDGSESEPKWSQYVGEGQCETVFRKDGRQLAAFALKPIEGKRELRVVVMELDEDGAIVKSRELSAPDWIQWPEGSSISQDGKWLAASESTSGQQIYIWDLASEKREPRWILKQTENRYKAVCFALDSKSLLTGNDHGGIEHWQIDGQDPSLIKRISAHSNDVLALTFDPQGTTLFSGGLDHRIIARQWPLNSEPAVPLQAHSDWISQLAFDSAGQTMFSASWDHTVRRWNKVDSQWTVESLSGHSQSVMSIAFTRDGQRMATGSTCDIGRDKPNQLLIWHFGGETPSIESMELPCTGWIRGLAFSHDGTQLAACDDKGVRTWDANSGMPLEVIRHTVHEDGEEDYDSPGASVVFRGDSLVLFSGWSKPHIRATSLEADVFRTLASAEPTNHHIEPMDLSDDGTRLAAASTNQASVWIFDSTSLKLLHEFEVSAATSIDCLDDSPDGMHLAVGTRNKRVVVIEDPEGTCRQYELKGHTNVVASVSFGNEGRILASGDWDGNVILWDVASRKERSRWRFAGRIWKLTFAPDGRHLAVGDGTGLVYFLRLTAID